VPRPGRPAPADSHRPAGAGRPNTLTSPAVAARIRQLAAQAEHRRAIADFHARRAADQQARADALLLEAIAALASLLSEPGQPATTKPDRLRPGMPHRPANDAVITKTCQNVNPERCRIMCKQRGR
jgi:hypothetical protein